LKTNPLFSYLYPHRWMLLLALLLASINQIFSLLDPVIFRHVIDEYASKPGAYTSEDFFKGVLFLLGASVGVAFISRTAKNVQDYFVNILTQKVGAKMYTDGIAHSLQLPYIIFEDQQSGEILSRLQKIRLDVEKLLSTSINTFFTMIVGLVFVMIYSLSVHWIIAPIYLITAPLLGVVSTVLSRKIKLIQTDIVRESALLAGSTTESLRNIQLVKSLGLADQEISRLNLNTDKLLQLELKKVKYLRSLSFIQGTVVNFLRTTLTFTLLYLIYIEAITFGQFFSLYIYSFFIFGPLQEFGGVIGTFKEAEVSLQKFNDIISTPVETIPDHSALLPTLESITLSDVSFKYPAGNKAALSDVSVQLNKGDTVAFVGPSGSGKTTLVKLLVGLYPPTAGEILFNKISATNFNMKLIREKVGIVTQESHLFAGTIRENLLFVKPNATDEECISVLNQSACANILERAKSGLDTFIGEGGLKLSGGEKQRLSIARALLRNPTLLIFDEATSSLDSLTEEEITTTVRSISAEKTHITVMIAHRLSTILHADTIYVLEKGKIIESGNHETLYAQKGLYYAMWRQQIGENRS
jgi:ATP-binding cassette subfamily B protein